MSEALRLFRDFVEKLERAYIAFDGVVGSCLGRAWGSTNHGMEDDDVDVIPRNSESNIAECASFSLPIGLLFRSYSLSFPNTSLVHRSRVLFFFFSLHSALQFLKGGKRKNLTVCQSNRWLMSQKSLSLFLSSFLSFLLTAYFPICVSLSFFLSDSCSRVISILEWVNAYSKQPSICRYS